jgi:uncharacterized membrane protein
MYVAMARLSHLLLAFTWTSFAAAHGTGAACGLLVLGVGVGARQALHASHWPDLAILACLMVVCVGTALAAVSLLPRTWRPDGAERVISVAFGMAPGRIGTALMKLFRVSRPASQA